MKLVPVESSNIQAIGWKKDVLILKFHKQDRVYLYYGVPKTLHMNFMKAKSKGKFFMTNIVNKFDYSELVIGE